MHVHCHLQTHAETKLRRHNTCSGPPPQRSLRPRQRTSAARSCNALTAPRRATAPSPLTLPRGLGCKATAPTRSTCCARRLSGFQGSRSPAAGASCRPGCDAGWAPARAQVHLGNRVTFLPTPLRNWWGRPNLLRAWFALSIYMIVVMVHASQLIPFLSLPSPSPGARVRNEKTQCIICPNGGALELGSQNFRLGMRVGPLPFTRSPVSCRA